MGRAHTLLHRNGVVRIQSDIRAGTRTDKVQTFQEKVAKVESILSGDSSSIDAKPGMSGKLSAKAQGVPIDAEGNQGQLAEQRGWKDKITEAVGLEQQKTDREVKVADVVTTPEVVGPGKVDGSWKGMLKE